MYNEGSVSGGAAGHGVLFEYACGQSEHPCEKHIPQLAKFLGRAHHVLATAFSREDMHAALTLKDHKEPMGYCWVREQLLHRTLPRFEQSSLACSRRPHVALIRDMLDFLGEPQSVVTF